MAVKTSWSSGDVLTAADLTDTFAAKADIAGATYTGTHDFTGATVTGAGGMVHIATQSVSAGSGIIFNNVFSATYSAYRIVARADQIFTARLRYSGADDTGSNYIFQYIAASAASVTGGRSTSTSWDLGGSGGDKFIVIDLYDPAASKQTIGISHLAGYPSSALQTALLSYYHTLASGYDGISLLGTSITATASIYGYMV